MKMQMLRLALVATIMISIEATGCSSKKSMSGVDTTRIDTAKTSTPPTPADTMKKDTMKKDTTHH